MRNLTNSKIGKIKLKKLNQDKNSEINEMKSEYSTKSLERKTFVRTK
jgi:hypothetical protein